MPDPDHALIEKVARERMIQSQADPRWRAAISTIRVSGNIRLQSAGFALRIDSEDGLGCWDHNQRGLRIIHSIAKEVDGEIWAHLSLSRRDRQLPDWPLLAELWRLVHPDVVGLQVIPLEENHVNIGEVLHLWGCLTNDVIPDFTHGTGSI